MSTTSPVETAQRPSSSRASSHGSKAVAHSILNKILIILLQAGTGIVTARALQPAGRGELAAMILWSQFVANLTSLGVPSSLIFFLRRQPENRTRLIGTGFFMATFLGIFGGLIAAVALPWWLHQYSPSIVHAAQMFLIITPICSLTLAGRAILEASDAFNMSNAIQTLTPLVTLMGLLLFAAFHHLNPYTAGLCYIIAAFPAFVLMLTKVGKVGFQKIGFDPAMCRLMISYGVRSYGIDLLGTLALQVDQVLVVSLLSPSAMGSYVVVLSLSRMMNLFQNSVVMVLFPKASGRSPEEVVHLTGRSARVSGMITIICGLFVCLAGPILLRILYGKEYVSAVGALRILVIEVILSGATFVLAQAFMALGRPGVVTMLQGVGLSLSIPLMLWFIPRYGIYGAAVSLLLSTTARFLFIYTGFRRFLKIDAPKMVPTRSDINLLVHTALSMRPNRAA